jgi:hypothetical protein
MTAGRPLARLGAIMLLVVGGTLAGVLLLVAVELGPRALGAAFAAAHFGLATCLRTLG